MLSAKWVLLFVIMNADGSTFLALLRDHPPVYFNSQAACEAVAREFRRPEPRTSLRAICRPLGEAP